MKQEDTLKVDIKQRWVVLHSMSINCNDRTFSSSKCPANNAINFLYYKSIQEFLCSLPNLYRQDKRLHTPRKVLNTGVSKTTLANMIRSLWASFPRKESKEDNQFYLQLLCCLDYKNVLVTLDDVLYRFDLHLPLYREMNIYLKPSPRYMTEVTLDSRCDDTLQNTLAPLSHSEGEQVTRIVYINYYDDGWNTGNVDLDEARRSIETVRHLYIVFRYYKTSTVVRNSTEHQTIPSKTYVMYSKDGELQQKDYTEIEQSGCHGEETDNKMVLFQGDWKRNAVHFAATAGHVQILKVLVDYVRVPLSVKSSNQLSVLHLSVMYGQEEIVDLICKREPALIDHTDTIGRTALHIAAQRNRMHIVRNLIQHGADVYRTPGDGSTLLHIAASQSQPHMLEYLCNKFDFAKLNIVNKIGLKPIQFAARYNPSNVQTLIDHGESSWVRTNNGATIAHTGAYHGNLHVLKYIVTSCKGLASIVDKFGRGPAHYICKEGHIKCLEYLIEMTEDCVFAKSSTGETIAHTAVRHGQLDVLKLLGTKCRAMFTETDVDGNTVGHIAVRYRQSTCLDYLLQSKLIDPATRDKRGQTILNVARQINDTILLQRIYM